eukprot:1159177-Pelagomonas_calceolata.AAC.18
MMITLPGGHATPHQSAKEAFSHCRWACYSTPEGKGSNFTLPGGHATPHQRARAAFSHTSAQTEGDAFTTEPKQRARLSHT